MHQTRRRKKRCSYGIKTVEIQRGKNGFGFTISGQAPCKLSCIVSGSPADLAGLRPGDYLIAVNGLNISKSFHDDVVRLIGTTIGVLTLQISENYFSDSSEEELINSRPRPKYPHRLRHRHQLRTDRNLLEFKNGGLNKNIIFNKFSSKDDYGLHSASSFHNLKCKNHFNLGEIYSPSKFKKTSIKSEKKSEISKQSNKINELDESSQCFFTEQELTNLLYPLLVQENDVEIKDDNQEEISEIVTRAVVGYLGTIEMPKEPQVAGSRLQAIRNCIRRLRIEKKVHTLVLLTVYHNKVVLTNPHGLTLAEYPSEKITFCGVYADDKKFFGLVTMHATNSEFNNDPAASSSCHVFMVDVKLHPHVDHISRAKAFGLDCTKHSQNGTCLEFPDSADPILLSISSLYRNRCGLQIDSLGSGLVDVGVVNASPQPSTSSNSSNSDSGIGFRDEGNHHSDRVVVVDVENNLYRVQSMDGSEISSPNICAGKDVGQILLNSKHLEAANTKNISVFYDPLENQELENSESSDEVNDDRLTVRAMPDPVGFINSPNSSYNTERLDAQTSADNLRSSIHKYLQSKNLQLRSTSEKIHKFESSGRHSNLKAVPPQIIEEYGEYVDLVSHKLSPKVYNFPSPQLDCSFTRSLEDIRDKPLSQTHPYEKFLHRFPSLPDGSESEHYIDRYSFPVFQMKPSKHLHGSETNLSLYSSNYHEDSSGEPMTFPEVQSNCKSVTVDHSRANACWSRTSSLRRNVSRQRPISKALSDQGTLSDTELGQPSTTASCDGNSTTTASTLLNRPSDVGRVGSWAASFEKLLRDSAGIHTFAEFLKKEFSHENIYFWAAVQRYHHAQNSGVRKALAKCIFDRHLSVNAIEPVNVDAQARQKTQEDLKDPQPDTFNLAEDQIFKLMKQDCYPRFLKSPFYKESVLKEMAGKDLPYPGGESLSPDLKICDEIEMNGDMKLQKSKSDASEDRWRRSLLPWHKKARFRGRSKSKDRIHANMRPKSKNRSQSVTRKTKCERNDELGGSRTSLASSDLAMISRRLSTSRESVSTTSSRNGFEESSSHLCRVVLPDHSTAVISMQKDETIQVLVERLLEKRGLKYSGFEVYINGSTIPLDQNEKASSIACQDIKVEQRIVLEIELPNKKCTCLKAMPGRKLQDAMKSFLQSHGYKLDNVNVQLDSDKSNLSLKTSVNLIDGQKLFIQQKNANLVNGKTSKGGSNATSLEEITFKVFEDLDLIQLKNPVKQEKDMSLWKSIMPPPTKLPIPKKRIIPPKLTGESEDLYEDLKRAQNGRLEDQRGTEINFELPEFLKTRQVDKENLPRNDPARSKHSGIPRLSCISNIFDGREDFDDNFPLQMTCLNNSFSNNGIVPSRAQAENYFQGRELSCRKAPVLGRESRLRVSLDMRCPMRPISQPPLNRTPIRFGNYKVRRPHSALDPIMRDASNNLDLQDLDLDMDVTMKREDPNATLTPSKVPYPENPHSQSQLLGEANYSPPPALDLDDPLTVDNVILSSPQMRYRQSLEPPPLPPKPTLIRGPPPRPPSVRNSGFCFYCSSEEDDQKLAKLSQEISVGKYGNHCNHLQLSSVPSQSYDHTENFNISFV